MACATGVLVTPSQGLDGLTVTVDDIEFRDVFHGNAEDRPELEPEALYERHDH